MSESAQAPYEQLLTLGICELELAREGRIEELLACQERRAELIASLPAEPPPDAREALERCLAIERRLEHELGAARGVVLEALAELRRALRAAEGYTPLRDRLRLVSTDA